VRAGASEVVLVGSAAACEALRALCRGDRALDSAELFVGAAPKSTLPVVEAEADLVVPCAVWEAAARARAPKSALTPAASSLRRVTVRRVRTKREARAATRAIVCSLERDRGSLFARVNGRLSRPITAALVDTAATPAQLTAAHALVGLVSAWLFAFGGEGALLAAGALFDAASILDGVDGELARARLVDSEAGAWLDTAGDALVYVAFAFALPWGYARFAAERGLPWAPCVGLVGAALPIGALVLIVGMAREARARGLGGSMSGVAASLAPEVDSAPLRRVRDALLALGRRACFARLIAILCALAAITGAHAFYDALFFGTVLVVVTLACGFVYASARSSRRLRADSAAPRVRLGRERSGPAPSRKR
jgi:CDP-L-myo-inositol myo-inositolphosphotransferase